jgi:hypothetical protein
MYLLSGFETAGSGGRLADCRADARRQSTSSATFWPLIVCTTNKSYTPTGDEHICNPGVVDEIRCFIFSNYFGMDHAREKEKKTRNRFLPSLGYLCRTPCKMQTLLAKLKTSAVSHLYFFFPLPFFLPCCGCCSGAKADPSTTSSP